MATSNKFKSENRCDGLRVDQLHLFTWEVHWKYLKSHQSPRPDRIQIEENPQYSCHGEDKAKILCMRCVKRHDVHHSCLCRKMSQRKNFKNVHRKRKSMKFCMKAMNLMRQFNNRREINPIAAVATHFIGLCDSLI